MSLRVRLVLVFAALFLVGMIGIFGRSMHAARLEVREEIEFSRQVVTLVVQLLEPRIAADGDPIEARRLMLASLRGRLQGLETADKFDIEVHLRDFIQAPTALLDRSRLAVPAWFLALLGLDERSLILEYELPDGEAVLIVVDPVGKINELWAEVSYISTTRLGSMLTLAMVLYLLVGYWMRPVGKVVAALDRLVAGDYSRRLPAIPVREIHELGSKVNFLAETLGASKAENERLSHKAMTVQEQERRFLAQELHDTLGQAASAIKAMAVSIANRSAGQPAILESAHNIEKVSDEAYHSVRNLMAWLRPAILDELGLNLALQQMVDDWNMHHDATFCALRLETDLSALSTQRQIQVYRIVQEALTNVVKHAEAERVTVTILGDERVEMVISDDGCGFDLAAARTGIGLANIRDRAKLLQGQAHVRSASGEGTILHISFPREENPEQVLNDGE